MQLYGHLHADLCNVPRFRVPRVRMQIKPTKAKPSIYLMHTDPSHAAVFKFLDAKLCQTLQGKTRIHNGAKRNPNTWSPFTL
jgi:hypothetical protein